ncbi:MAG: DUF1214 domain-containing protein [Acidimicrobiales bacterium]|nr:DUF1214 domain-containing protein [Acidimicrobiales bacterium]
MTAAPKSSAMYDELVSLLGDVRDDYILNPERFRDSLEVSEAFLYVGQLLATASEFYMEADPERPRFASIVTPARKMQGDNPDAIYHFARIQGDRTYRVTGKIDKECYTSFTVHGRAEDGGMAGPLLGDLNDRDFDVEPDGSYELIFSADQQPGNWVRLDPEAYALITRAYFQLPVSAQNDPAVQVNIDIECLDDVGPPPPLTDAVLAERMADAVGFVRQTTLKQNVFGGPSPVPFVSDVPNELPAPFSFRDTGLPVPGAADIFYASCQFQLQPDEALVMSGVLPPGPFANVMLWNTHMQTFDYRNRTTSLNGAQMELGPGGEYRIVISEQDPGVPNWMDTAGHARGTVFWRFLLPESDPPKPECSVVPVNSLR